MWLSIAEQHGIDTASLTPTLRTQNRKETELIKYAAHNAAQTELTQLTQLHDRLWEVQNAAD